MSLESEYKPLKKKPKYQTLKSQHYHNNSILSPTGVVLCKCGDKKINWYLSRGLAKVVGEVCKR